MRTSVTEMGILKGARIAVKECMNVSRGEVVLVVTDQQRHRVASYIFSAAREASARVTMLIIPTLSRHGEEPPKVVAEAMRAADVVFAPTTYSLTHTQARKRATEAGVRIATMPMITEEMMCRGAMLADYREVSQLTKKVAGRLNRCREVEVTSAAGTELGFSVKGRKAHPDTGIFHRPGDFGNLPAGEAFIAPVEGTGEGTVVVDGSMIDKVHGKIKIEIRGGRAVKFSGGPSRRLEAILKKAGKKAFNLAEFGVGTNPKAQLIGNVLEDEKVLGTCHVALGDNSTFGGKVQAGVHVDGIFLKPTVKLDGKVLMKSGKLLP
ncbi:MAG: aminopeptidase [Candidatus Hadarchaeota archaeon]